MKTYGLIVADNGSDMFITGSSDPRWEAQMDDFVSAFHGLRANQFEVVQLGWHAARRQPTATACPTLGDDLRPRSRQRDRRQRRGAAIPTATASSNAAERTAGTHPRGFERRLFAEGVVERVLRDPPRRAEPVVDARRTSSSGSCARPARRSRTT